MKQIIIYTILALALAAPAFACISDADCDSGNSCVKVEGSVHPGGRCVSKRDSFGNADTSYSLKTVTGCSFDTDCKTGYTCTISSGDIKGLCTK